MQKTGHLAFGERIPQVTLFELTRRRHRRTEVAGERPRHRGPPEEAAQCRHVGQARGDGLCPQPDQELVNVTGRDGGEPGHAVLLETRGKARELPHPPADRPWSQPAMGAQERGVLTQSRPRTTTALAAAPARCGDDSVRRSSASRKIRTAAHTKRVRLAPRPTTRSATYCATSGASRASGSLSPCSRRYSVTRSHSRKCCAVTSG